MSQVIDDYPIIIMVHESRSTQPAVSAQNRVAFEDKHSATLIRTNLFSMSFHIKIIFFVFRRVGRKERNTKHFFLLFLDGFCGCQNYFLMKSTVSLIFCRDSTEIGFYFC